MVAGTQNVKNTECNAATPLASATAASPCSSTASFSSRASWFTPLLRVYSGISVPDQADLAGVVRQCVRIGEHERGAHRLGAGVDRVAGVHRLGQQSEVIRVVFVGARAHASKLGPCARRGVQVTACIPRRMHVAASATTSPHPKLGREARRRTQNQLTAPNTSVGCTSPRPRTPHRTQYFGCGEALRGAASERAARNLLLVRLRGIRLRGIRTGDIRRGGLALGGGGGVQRHVDVLGATGARRLGGGAKADRSTGLPLVSTTVALPSTIASALLRATSPTIPGIWPFSSSTLMNSPGSMPYWAADCTRYWVSSSWLTLTCSDSAIASSRIWLRNVFSLATRRPRRGARRPRGGPRSRGDGAPRPRRAAAEPGSRPFSSSLSTIWSRACAPCANTWTACDLLAEVRLQLLDRVELAGDLREVVVRLWQLALLDGQHVTVIWAFSPSWSPPRSLDSNVVLSPALSESMASSMPSMQLARSRPRRRRPRRGRSRASSIVATRSSSTKSPVLAGRSTVIERAEAGCAGSSSSSSTSSSVPRWRRRELEALEAAGRSNSGRTSTSTLT